MGLMGLVGGGSALTFRGGIVGCGTGNVELALGGATCDVSEDLGRLIGSNSPSSLRMKRLSSWPLNSSSRASMACSASIMALA